MSATKPKRFQTYAVTWQNAIFHAFRVPGRDFFMGEYETDVIERECQRAHALRAGMRKFGCPIEGLEPHRIHFWRQETVTGYALFVRVEK